MDSTQPTETRKAFARLALGALGVVFGDIGTSPLYTIHSTFVGENLAVTEPNVLGVLSMVFWLLVVVVSLKYVVFIMRADNRGEGGIIALMALAQRGARDSVMLRRAIVIFGLLGASLFYGDGVITPAISVLSAVEGLKVVAPTLEHSIVPVTIAILVLLFMVQSRGTGKVGVVFGPIMLVWFVVIGVLGIKEIATQPRCCKRSIHSRPVVLLAQRIPRILALGGVVLASPAPKRSSGMGHLGKKPIRVEWFGLVPFALLLNYFGQGALLLLDPDALDNPFYHLVPDALQLPMLVLACVATVIASQAVITGAFSMTREAIQLGYAPRMEVKHTSRQMHGEIYVPWVNRALFVMVIAAVIGFRSSDNLGAAYGIAVTGTMWITSLLALVVQRRLSGWPRWIVIGLGIVGLSIDTTLLGQRSRSPKALVPLVAWPIRLHHDDYLAQRRDLVLRELKTSDRAGAFRRKHYHASPLRAGHGDLPPANVRRAKRTAAQPQAQQGAARAQYLLTVETLTHRPRSTANARNHRARHDFYRLIVRFGFSEDPHIPRALQSCEAKGLGFDMMDTTFFLSRETIVATDRPGMPLWRDKIFVYLVRNASSATAFFRIPGNRLIELGTQVEI